MNQMAWKRIGNQLPLFLFLLSSGVYRSYQETDCLSQRPLMALLVWPICVPVDRISRLGLCAAGMEGIPGTVYQPGRREVWSAKSSTSAQRIAAGVVEGSEPRRPLHDLSLGYSMEGTGLCPSTFQIPPQRDPPQTPHRTVRLYTLSRRAGICDRSAVRPRDGRALGRASPRQRAQ